MNFDPQKFFIGVMDFFSILLPGALLTWLLMDSAGPVLLGDRYAALTGAQAWAAFLFASYLLGHLVFLLGSWLDRLYDWARRYTVNAQIGRLGRRGKLIPWPLRALVWLVFQGERNVAQDRVLKIKRQALDTVDGNDAINAFQWSKAILNLESPASLAVVQRFEADSKFFRCFTVVLLILLAAWRWLHLWPPAGIAVVIGLLLLALWRYMEQRFKATNQAYWSVITLTAQKGKSLEKAAVAVDGPQRAGGVVFRKPLLGEVRFLLVEASDDPKQWVLPKGHVEAGEERESTAVREVHEETGTWARVLDHLGDVSYSVDGSVVRVRFFLMQAIGRGIRQEKDRQHAWFQLTEAVAQASHNETRELLQAAEQRISSMNATSRSTVRKRRVERIGTAPQ